MNKRLGAALTAALFAGGFAANAFAAPPRDWNRDRADNYVRDYCGQHRSDRDCRDWDHNRHSWNEDRYHQWYRSHQRDFGPADAAAAIFGFVAGAAAGAVNGAVDTSHRAACEARYRSYDWHSGTYMGFDGQRHYCRL